MALILSLDDMIDYLRTTNHPSYGAIKAEAERVAQNAANFIAETLGCEVGEAEACVPDFGGLSVCFSGPPEMPVPEALAAYDVGGNFHE